MKHAVRQKYRNSWDISFIKSYSWWTKNLAKLLGCISNTTPGKKHLSVTIGLAGPVGILVSRNIQQINNKVFFIAHILTAGCDFFCILPVSWSRSDLHFYKWGCVLESNMSYVCHGQKFHKKKGMVMMSHVTFNRESFWINPNCWADDHPPHTRNKWTLVPLV